MLCDNNNTHDSCIMTLTCLYYSLYHPFVIFFTFPLFSVTNTPYCEKEPYALFLIFSLRTTSSLFPKKQPLLNTYL